MENRGGILRYITACLICICLISYNFYHCISGGTTVTALDTSTAASFAEDDPLTVEQAQASEPQNSSNASESASSKAESTSSVSASAAAVKGKVISQYISPYNAPQSYNNTYMKNSTPLDVDIKTLLNASLQYKIEKNDSPQVLIMHTHTTECFMSEDAEYYTEDFNSRTTDNSKNMAKIGDIVAEKLNAAGIKTVHDTTQHDYPEYTGSYSRAAKTINSYLKKYPSIKVVLDLHRDAVTSGESDKVKLVTEINGKKAAQVMLVMGSQSGSITNHPNWQENLKLALKLQQTMEVKYPTLARPLSLMSKGYNQSLCTGSLLIEFGTDVNTLDEACYSAELVADSLVTLLNTLG